MKDKRNADIKQLMKSKNITQYDLSLKMNCCENTVYRLLRSELSKESHDKLISIIEDM